jgi:hypothetical protein
VLEVKIELWEKKIISWADLLYVGLACSPFVAWLPGLNYCEPLIDE